MCPRPNVRRLLPLLLLLLLAPAAAQAAPKRVLTFGIQPQWTREQMERMFQPLMRYLTEKTGYEFRLRVTEDYGALLDEMNSGMVDLGKFAPYGYVMAKRSQGVRIFATELTAGRPYYRGYVIARRDSGIKTFDDLKGRTFSYTDPNSASGFIYPRALLVEKGVDPNTFFKETFFAGSHDVCIRGVYSKKVDAGATWDVAFEDEAESALLGVKKDELVIVHKTERIPNDAYAARADLDPAIVQAVQRALLELSQDKKRLREVIDWKTRIDGFVAGDDAAYEPVRAKVALKDMKSRLAVLPFDKRGVGFKMVQPGSMAAELLSTKLIDTQRFIVVDRAKIDQALASESLPPDQALDPAVASRVGQKVGASILLAGSVMLLDGRTHLTWRLVETDTGKILWAQHAKGDELDQVVDEVAAQIISNYDVKGFLLKVTGTENVTVDLGSAQGVKPGDEMVVYKDGEPLLHPVTGKVLGTEEIVLGEVVAARTTPEISFAKVVAADHLLQQGYRVRTLRKGEAARIKADPELVSQYLSEERTKYEPWLSKYAWRVAAVGTIPAVWALIAGKEQDRMVYGGLALGLWGIAGGSYLYYSATEDTRKVPSYLGGSSGGSGNRTQMIGVGGSF